MLNVIPVTVIIPCYRCSSSIGRAIKSISSQTYRPKEVILIDDYSDDEGKNLSELYKLKKLYNDIFELLMLCSSIING